MDKLTPMSPNYSFLDLCREASSAASDAVSNLVGDSKKAGKIVGMGADGTPTAKIDLVAEAAILEVLQAEGRSMRIISEELGEIVIGDSPEVSFILDPLDGTYNAAFGIPIYNVSLAAASPDSSQIFFGYVRNLAVEEEYFAEKGRGAYLNGKAIRPSKNTDPHNICISAYGYRKNLERGRKLQSNIRRLRILGSVALELCYVASGKLDAFVDIRNALRVTDVAAGQLILKEAGGAVTDSFGKPLKLPANVVHRVEMVASNGHVHQKLLQLLSGE